MSFDNFGGINQEIEMYYDMTGGLHPVVYVGGSSVFGSGAHSGGQYPFTGSYLNIEPIPGFIDPSEDVYGAGPIISYSSFIGWDKSGNLVILPGNPDYIDHANHPEMSWFGAKVPWGYTDSPTYPGGAIAKLIDGLTDIGNDPPLAPPYRDGWNSVGNAGGKYELFDEIIIR